MIGSEMVANSFFIGIVPILFSIPKSSFKIKNHSVFFRVVLPH